MLDRARSFCASLDFAVLAWRHTGLLFKGSREFSLRLIPYGTRDIGDLTIRFT